MTVTVEELASHLPTFLDRVASGEQFIIVRNGTPVGTLSPPPNEETKRKYGWAIGILTIQQDDDEHLQDFAEYMP